MQLSSKTLLPALILCSTLVGSLARARTGPAVWIAPSLHRVGMSDAAGSETQAALWAARGEYESFQIVANGGSKGLSDVNVTVSDLRGPEGEVIPRTNFTLYREKYVYVKSSSPNWKGPNQPMAPGWYPDALIPFTDPESGKPLSGAALRPCRSISRPATISRSGWICWSRAQPKRASIQALTRSRVTGATPPGKSG